MLHERTEGQCDEIGLVFFAIVSIVDKRERRLAWKKVMPGAVQAATD
jgi:hypothetical protein